MLDLENYKRNSTTLYKHIDILALLENNILQYRNCFQNSNMMREKILNTKTKNDDTKKDSYQKYSIFIEQENIIESTPNVLCQKSYLGKITVD